MNKTDSYNKIYILPNLYSNKTSKLNKYVESLEKKENSFFNQILEFEELLKTKRVFVMGEPGYGKSRLSKQLIKKFEEKKCKCCFIDLKDTKGNFLETYIDNKKGQNNNDFYKTKNFTLKNLKKRVLFFDALDEVQADTIPSLIEEIDSIIKKYPLIKIFLSCRTHHVSRYKNQLSKLDFDCIEIQSFSIFQSIEFLKKKCRELKNKTNEEILQQLNSTNLYKFSFLNNSSNNTIKTPRYLEVLSKLINIKGFENVINLNRGELFDLFIIERLKEESKNKKYKQKIPYIKQCLERLALIMEIQRVNQISKDDFVTFLLDTNLNLDNQMLLEVFFDGTILKDNEDKIEFDNTEFQEYLAAKALTRIGRLEQIIFDLTIEQKLQDVFPSWINTLTYLFELNPEVLLPIIIFACRTENQHLFELIKYPKASHFQENKEESDEIFLRIFSYYQNRKKIIPYQFEFSLSDFYEHSKHYPLLLSSSKKGKSLANYISQTNSVLIVKELLDRGIFNDDEKNKWKKTLLSFAKNSSNHGDALQIASIKALGLISSIEEIAPILKFKDSPNKSLRDVILRSLSNIDRNHPTTIDLIILNMAKEGFFSIYELGNITKASGFEYFLSKVLDRDVKVGTQSLLEMLNESSFSYSYGKQFFQTLETVWNKKLEQLVIKVLIESCRSHGNYGSFFFDELAKILRTKNPNSSIEILKEVIGTNFFEEESYWVGELIGRVVTPSILDEIFQICRDGSLEEAYQIWILRSSPYKEISSKIKKYFPKFHKKSQKQTKNREQSKKLKDLKIDAKIIDNYNQFTICLNEGHAHLMVDYPRYDESLKSLLKPSQKKKLKKLIESMLEKYDPKDGKIESTGEHRYSDTLFSFYENTVILAKEFKVDLSPFRDKILKLVPTVNDLSLILESVNNPTKNEIQQFFKWFNQDRDDVLHFHRIYNLIDFCKKNDFKEATDYLTAIVIDEKLDSRHRIHALEVLFSWNVREQKYFINLFNKYSKRKKWSENYLVAVTINNMLLKARNEEALDWRIAEVLKMKYEIRRSYSGIRGVGKMEDFGLPLRYVLDINYKGKFLDLLEESFKCLKSKKDYYRYVENEIWKPTIEYFKNLKNHKNRLKDFLEELTVLTKKFDHISDVRSFFYYIRELKKYYMTFLGKPIPISSSIRKYQQIKSIQYLDIVYPDELYKLIQEVINLDLRQWVNQGYYGFIGDLKNSKNKKVERERIIQKTIVTQLENFLLKRGLRNSDIMPMSPNFYREIEKLDGDKVDLVISYGAIGSVMVEIKRASNSDLTPRNREKYKSEKFLPYMNEVNCDFGIFLIFRDNKKPKDFPYQLNKIREVYKDHRNIIVIGLDCL